ncbi:MAG: hypothetical protein CMI36_09495 [Owenweeksia sp.]|nr:hypothetical protein [Owenweeksia sp.]MBF99216.1 hypothetical protein [Owenweeksia sp.]HBF19655.1 hypothetical protein [Cryomorphaceae bacterium]HCQ15291.1 hypothetical protein [Cryomorphaceae bacterium]|tara:strand:+ start:167 stop:538 length:372 start_codon:yes stop_codon:yes gene_type:complete
MKTLLIAFGLILASTQLASAQTMTATNNTGVTWVVFPIYYDTGCNIDCETGFYVGAGSTANSPAACGALLTEVYAKPSSGCSGYAKIAVPVPSCSSFPITVSYSCNGNNYNLTWNGAYNLVIN